MFRKSKAKVDPPPVAPSLEEMLEDLETFEINKPTVGSTTDNVDLEHALMTEPENLSIQTWWRVFDEYDQKVKKMAETEENLESQRNQLKDCYDKLEANANKLKEGIKKQQSLINVALKN